VKHPAKEHQHRFQQVGYYLTSLEEYSRPMIINQRPTWFDTRSHLSGIGFPLRGSPRQTYYSISTPFTSFRSWSVGITSSLCPCGCSGTSGTFALLP
jgi:hypothetical protein